MPKSLTTEEKRFLRFYVKEGGVEEKIRPAELRARLKVGSGAKMLKSKHVAEAFRAMMEPILQEQQRQQMVGEAVAIATAEMAAKNAELQARLDGATQMPSLTVMGNETVIEQELMRLVRLCPEKHGRIKLASIQTAFVVAGLMEQGTTRRVTPLDKPITENPQSIYTNLFERLRLERAAATTAPEAAEPEPAPAPEDKVIDAVAGDDGVFDLTPPSPNAKPPVTISEGFVIPLAGESIDEVVPAAVLRKPTHKSAASVITVEVG